MKKFRTTKEYSALITAMAEELMHKTKYELAALLAYEKVSELMEEEFDHDHQPKLDEMRAATEKKEAQIEKLRDSIEGGQRQQLKELYQKLHDAPRELAKRGGQITAEKSQEILKKKFEFLDEQTDTSDTGILARRIDRQFSIKGRQPYEGEPASRGAGDTVRDWKRLRSASKTEKTTLKTRRNKRKAN